MALQGDFLAKAKLEYKDKALNANIDMQSLGGNLQLDYKDDHLKWQIKELELSKLLYLLAQEEKLEAKIDTSGSFYKNKLEAKLNTKSLSIDKDEIRRGMVICKPGSVTPHAHFKAEVYVLSKEEGGRHTPFFNKYRPQFYLRTTDVTGEIMLPDGVEMVMPGDNVTIDVQLISTVAMEKGLRFAIREGGRTVGAGQVTEIID